MGSEVDIDALERLSEAISGEEKPYAADFALSDILDQLPAIIAALRRAEKVEEERNDLICAIVRIEHWSTGMKRAIEQSPLPVRDALRLIHREAVEVREELGLTPSQIRAALTNKQS